MNAKLVFNQVTTDLYKQNYHEPYISIAFSAFVGCGFQDKRLSDKT